uniref:Hypersensitive response-inducing protein n=3 Tax=Ophiostoma TaxID=5159 RepID=A9NJI2_OPHUL|nr:hypersensitive response-inducing protein [Ophiostoma ulmi]
MKFSAAAILSAVVAVSANPTVARAEPVFAVSNFQAGCIPHSSQCRYSFDVIKTGTGETIPVSCVLLKTSNNVLPDVTDGTCIDSSRTFSFKRRAEGLTFTVSQQITPSSNQTGTYLIPKNDFIFTKTTTASVEEYTGPKAFTLTDQTI